MSEIKTTLDFLQKQAPSLVFARLAVASEIPIDKGGFAQVFPAEYKTTPQNASLIVRNLFNPEKDAPGETKALYLLANSKVPTHCLGPLYYDEKSGKSVSVQASKSLYAFLEPNQEQKQLSEPLTEPLIKSWIYQLLHGLKSFHDNGLVHRDIKSDNFLLLALSLHYADFGSLREADEQGLCKDKESLDESITLHYLPEEIKNLRDDLQALKKQYKLKKDKNLLSKEEEEKLKNAHAKLVGKFLDTLKTQNWYYLDRYALIIAIKQILDKFINQNPKEGWPLADSVTKSILTPLRMEEGFSWEKVLPINDPKEGFSWEKTPPIKDQNDKKSNNNTDLSFWGKTEKERSSFFTKEASKQLKSIQLGNYFITHFGRPNDSNYFYFLPENLQRAIELAEDINQTIQFIQGECIHDHTDPNLENLTENKINQVKEIFETDKAIALISILRKQSELNQCTEKEPTFQQTIETIKNATTDDIASMQFSKDPFFPLIQDIVSTIHHIKQIDPANAAIPVQGLLNHMQQLQQECKQDKIAALLYEEITANINSTSLLQALKLQQPQLLGTPVSLRLQGGQFFAKQKNLVDYIQTNLLKDKNKTQKARKVINALLKYLSNKTQENADVLCDALKEKRECFSATGAKFIPIIQANFHYLSPQSNNNCESDEKLEALTK